MPILEVPEDQRVKRAHADGVAIDALRASMEFATPVVTEAPALIGGERGGERVLAYSDPGFDASVAEDGGQAVIEINAGTIVGNPDELAQMVMNSVEGGGVVFNRFRILSAQAVG